MNVYSAKQIRNVAVLGHFGSGKTTLVEALAYTTGLTSRMGKVNDGNTISDFDKEEQKRGFSIGTSVVPIEHNGIKFNFLDTPGNFDFVGEVEEALAAAEIALIVINGKAGVEVGTQKAWKMCVKRNIPRLIFVTGMDDENASYKTIIEDLEERYPGKIAPFQLPIREGEKLIGFVDVIKMEGKKYVGKGQYVPCDIPGHVQEQL